MTRVTYAPDPGLTVPGEYQAEVESAVVSSYRINKKATVATIEWAFLVRAGEYEGERIKTSTPLDGPVFLLHRTLTALGIKPGAEWTFDYDEGSGRMTDPDPVGKHVKVFVRQHEGHTRVRVAPVFRDRAPPVSRGVRVQTSFQAVACRERTTSGTRRRRCDVASHRPVAVRRGDPQG